MLHNHNLVKVNLIVFNLVCTFSTTVESILVDYPDENNDEPAVLFSPVTHLNGKLHCLRFQYMMYGDNAGTIAIFIEV